LNKDNMLYTLVGILIGFVSAYLLFDAVSTRQPPRLTPELRSRIAMEGENPLQATGGEGAGEAPTDARTADTSNPGMGGVAPGGAGPANAEVQELRARVEQNPNDAEAVKRLADLNFDIRNWQRAQELYHHYLELRPADPDVLTDLGISYRETQKFDEALQQFRQARKLAPGHWQSYYNEVVVLAFDLKRYDEAGPLLEQLQRMQPGNPEVAKLADAVARQRSAA
jgi:hypothetical protein